MTTGTYEYKSDFARRYYQQGRAAGLAEGLIEGMVRALLIVLDARGISVPGDANTRIAECTDLDQLDTWVGRAAKATAIQDLFIDRHPTV